MKGGNQIGMILINKNGNLILIPFPLRASRSAIRIATTRFRMRVASRAFALKAMNWRPMPANNLWICTGILFSINLYENGRKRNKQRSNRTH